MPRHHTALISGQRGEPEQWLQTSPEAGNLGLSFRAQNGCAGGADGETRDRYTKGHTGTHSTALPTTVNGEAAPQSAD